jgi:antitoxin component YwqK of YwqJK toxin-antitoxin module
MEEATPGSLALREGKWYRQGGVEPFSGILSDYYPDGSRKSRSLVSHGFLEGLSEGWHTNGQKQVTEFYRAGVSHGIRTKWYPSGKKLSEVTVVHGKLEGTFSRYYEDGSLAESITLKDGLPNGPSSSYYPSGFLKAEAQLDSGKVIQQKFWNDRERTSPTLSSLPAIAPSDGGRGSG